MDNGDMARVPDPALVDGWEIWEVQDNETHWFLLRPGETIEQAMKEDDSLSKWNEEHDDEPPFGVQLSFADVDNAYVAWEGDLRDEKITLREAARRTAAFYGKGGTSTRLISSTCW